jgi:hypothetical protein
MSEDYFHFQPPVDEASKYLHAEADIAPSSHNRPLLFRSWIKNIIRDTWSTDLGKEILFPLELESAGLVFGLGLKSGHLSSNLLWRNNVEFCEWEMKLHYYMRRGVFVKIL